MGTIYRLTLQEMLRKKFLLVASLLAVLFLSVYGLGLYFACHNLHRQARELYPVITAQLMSMAIYMSGFLAALLVVFSAAGTVAGEIENGILHSIVPKPVHRSTVIGGKFFGVATISLCFNILLLAAIVGITWLVTGQRVTHLPEALEYYCLQPLVLLSVTFFCSVQFPAIAAGVSGVMLFMIGVIGGMMEQFGVFFHNQSLINTGIVSSLVIPTDPLYRLIYAAVTPKTGGLLSRAGPFGAASLPSIWMVVYAIVYILAFLGLTMRSFARKDL